MLARATKDFTSVAGKAYVHSSAGFAPASSKGLSAPEHFCQWKLLLTRERLCQEINVSLLVGGYLLDVAIERIGESSIDEVLVCVVFEALPVEGILQMLQSKSVVENVRCSCSSICTHAKGA